MFCLRFMSIALIGTIALACTATLNAQNPEALTEEQMKDFLLNAKVIKSRQSGEGITRPYRLTLSDGNLVHDASFQSIDEYRTSMQFENGKTEMNFRDSYRFNIAAYELAKLLGIEDMVPVTVERNWGGKTGSLSWWLPSKMNERTRNGKRIMPPDPDSWNKQIHKIQVLRQLVYDTDRNAQNILISEDWHVWRIDFSRAFRLYTTLENPKDITRCDRRLLQQLKQLDAAELEKKTKNLLNDMEIKGVMGRRDKIVAILEDLIANKGENEVLED